MNTYKRIHFIGIGGSGMSGLAGWFLESGAVVSGSDLSISQEKKQQLEAKGAQIFTSHYASHIEDSYELVVHSLAIPMQNPELAEARTRGIPCMSYPEAVGLLTKEYRTIAICGTHGKTTVTAMIAQIFIDAQFDPQVIIGSEIAALKNQNYRYGKGNILILEACEYKEAFLNYSPNCIVLNTLDPDHFDYYKTYEQYLDAFRHFASRLKKDGFLFGNTNDDDVSLILQDRLKHSFPSYNMCTYSIGDGQSTDYLLVGKDVYYKHEKLGTLELQVPGIHNRSNALAAFSVAHHFGGIASKDILESLHRYTGAHRRFEQKGSFGNAVVIDDYAHHPIEVRATLQAVRELYPQGKVCAVFQPHQFSRTHALLAEFAAAFEDADTVIIPNIYEARDTAEDKEKISAQYLVEIIGKKHAHVLWGTSLEQTESLLRESAGTYDVIITMGAGDIWKLSERLVSKASASI